MATEQQLTNRVRTCRIARGWSQDDLAARAGISRAGVSSIETNRLVPSTSAALALAAALDCRVEDLFQLGSGVASEVAWAWQPQREPCRYWRASVAGRELMYPTEATNVGVVGHDGVCQEGQFRERLTAAPSDTLVVASCDPAIGLLANELSRRSSFRLLAFPRSSKQALALLSQGVVHVAGIHLATVGRREQNSAAAKERLGGGFHLLRGARWQEGLALAPGLQLQSVHAAVESRARWVGREIGSAARELLDELLSNRRPPRRIAYGHRGVAEAVRCGWADVGVCLRLVSEEAGLDFLGVREEEYDYCYPADLEGDPRIQALVETVRSSSFRGALSDLPGYDTAETGELERIV
ncbi:MAG: substrate-binding domain-containing protein [Thermoguttaceae bacterium]